MLRPLLILISSTLATAACYRTRTVEKPVPVLTPVIEGWGDELQLLRQ